MSVRDIATSPHGALFALDSGKIYHLQQGDAPHLPSHMRGARWQPLSAQVDGEVVQIEAGVGGLLFALCADGSIYQLGVDTNTFIGRHGEWVKLPSTSPEPAAPAPPPPPSRQPVQSIPASGRSHDFELRRGDYVLVAPCVAAVERLVGKAWQDVTVSYAGEFHIPATGQVRINHGSYSGGHSHIYAAA